MLKKTVLQNGTKSVVIMDSITKATADDRGKAIVSASHGGASSGEFALEYPGAIVMFNDAGRGKDDAGIAALQMLDDAGVPGATISHESARIGDSQDHWDQGVISNVNSSATLLGFAAGQAVADSLKRWAADDKGEPTQAD